MTAEALESLGGWLQVVGTIGGLLAAASFAVLVVVGAVLWFVRGTHGVQAPPTDEAWFDALPEDDTPSYAHP
jgi:hypothetical protein